MKILLNSSGIYRIINTFNSKIYVGSAANFSSRCREHVRALNKGFHHNVLLQRAWNKYGKDAFTFSVIEHANKEDLLSREQHYLDTLNPEYNICKTAGSILGLRWRCSKETNKKKSLALKGRTFSDETKLKMSINHANVSGSNNPRYGKHCSEETKAKISLAKKGCVPWNKGKINAINS